VSLAASLPLQRLAPATTLHEDIATQLSVLHQHLKVHLQLSAVPIVATWPNQTDDQHQSERIPSPAESHMKIQIASIATKK